MPVANELSAIDVDQIRRGVATCVICKYNLRGLPACHNCPECGQEYDDLSEVLNPRWGGKLTVGTIVMMVVLFLWFGLGPVIMLLQALGIYFGVFLIMVLAAAVFALTAFHQKRRPFIMLGPNGIVFRSLYYGPDLVHWTEIDRVETPLPTGGFRNERFLYVFVIGRDQPINLSSVVNGVGVAERMRSRIMEVRDIRLARITANPPAR